MLAVCQRGTGLLLRRPREAMTRTIWLVGLMFVPIAIS